MNWFAFRQHRKQFLIFGIILALFAAFVIITGNAYWHDYQHALVTCQQTRPTPAAGICLTACLRATAP